MPASSVRAPFLVQICSLLEERTVRRTKDAKECRTTRSLEKQGNNHHIDHAALKQGALYACRNKSELRPCLALPLQVPIYFTLPGLRTYLLRSISSATSAGQG